MLRRVVVETARLLAGSDPEVYRGDFDACARTYDGVVTRPLLAAATERALAAAGLAPGMRCLDLGCGTGHSTAAILDLVRPGGTVTGCDFAPNMIDAARERLGGAPEADLVAGDVPQFLARLAPRSADFIGSFWSLEYMDHARVLREARRVLRPGGTICVLVNLRHSLAELQELVAPILLRHPLALRRIPPLNFLESAEEFGRVARRAGLDELCLKEEAVPCRFATGADLVDWMRDGGPAAGFRGSLREGARERMFRLIAREADRRGGIAMVFRYVRYLGRG